MKPRDPQEMGPDDYPWDAMAQQEIEEYEQWLDEMEAQDD